MLCDTNVTSTPEVSASAIFLLLVIGNKNERVWSDVRRRMTFLQENPSVGSYMNWEKQINRIGNSTKQRVKAVVPRVCFADPLGSATSSHGIHEYIYVMVALKVIYLH